MEVVSLVDLHRVQPLLQYLLRKIPWTHERHVAREGKQQYCIDLRLCKKAQLFWSWGQQLKPRVRTQNSHRVRFERHSDALGITLTGASNYFIEHAAVCAMYAVEVADADQGRPKICGYLVEFAEDEH